MFICKFQLVVIWIEMYREYTLRGGQHSLPFLFVAVSQLFYVIMEFFYDEVIFAFSKAHFHDQNFYTFSQAVAS